MLDEGADILDLGGESTRPNAIRSPPKKNGPESCRLSNRSSSSARRPSSPSTPTTPPPHAAPSSRRRIVNDVSGHLGTPQCPQPVPNFSCGTVLMHTRGRPQNGQNYRRSRPMKSSLCSSPNSKSASNRHRAGISRRQNRRRPRPRFGKRLDENYPILAHLEDLRDQAPHPHRCPPASASSPTPSAHTRARDRAPERRTTTMDDRSTPRHAANVAAILGGAHILRVHDVRAGVEASAIADRILDVSDQAASPEPVRLLTRIERFNPRLPQHPPSISSSSSSSAARSSSSSSRQIPHHPQRTWPHPSPRDSQTPSIGRRAVERRRSIRPNLLKNESKS